VLCVLFRLKMRIRRGLAYSVIGLVKLFVCFVYVHKKIVLYSYSAYYDNWWNRMKEYRTRSTPFFLAFRNSLVPRRGISSLDEASGYNF